MRSCLKIKRFHCRLPRVWTLMMWKSHSLQMMTKKNNNMKTASSSIKSKVILIVVCPRQQRLKLKSLSAAYTIPRDIETLSLSIAMSFCQRSIIITTLTITLKTAYYQKKSGEAWAYSKVLDGSTTNCTSLNLTFCCSKGTFELYVNRYKMKKN